MCMEEKMNWNTGAADLAAPPVETHGPVTLSRANFAVSGDVGHSG
jgi:hypothetical protein